MEIFLAAASILFFLAAAALIFFDRCRVRRIMEHMNRMLDAAVDGTFQEAVYDESMLSSVEAKLAHYLAASSVLKQNLNEEKEKVKGLISDISHQTKTPVSNILLYAQMLAEQKMQEPCSGFVSELNRQAEKLNFLIGSLVKISRLETGIFELHPKIAALSPVLEEVIEQISPAAKKKHLGIKYKTADLYACFDTKWTAEALFNIADNAVKYTPEGGEITFSVLNTELFVRIDIKDTGIGISEEETAKIFRRFYRSAAVGEKEGVGIGLYLARQIIAGEDGYIKVSSKVGEGSLFSVYLPNIESSTDR